MEEIVNLIMNNGIGVGCVAYLIHFTNTTMKEMGKTLSEIVNNLVLINSRLNIIEDKVLDKESEGE